jgi:hypothetical protein
MRYYLVPTIGIGTDADPYRPKIANYQCNWACVYEEPGEQNSVVAVNATPEVFAQIDVDSEITLLGDNLDVVITNEDFQKICPSGQVMIYG